MIQIKSRFHSTCPQCHGRLTAGEDIGHPQVKNRAGGMLFSGMWYCVPCATDLEEIGPGLPYIDMRAREEHARQLAPVHARLKSRRARVDAAGEGG